MRTFRRLRKEIFDIIERAVGEGGGDLRQKAHFTSDSLQLSALLSNDNVHNSSVPESFTTARSMRMRNTDYMAGGS